MSQRGLRTGGPDRRGIWRRSRRRCGALRRPWRAAPTRPAGGQGGLCQQRGLWAGGRIAAGYGDVRGGGGVVLLGRIAAGYGGGGLVLFDAVASGSDPSRWRSRRARSTAWPSAAGRIAAGYSDVRGGGGGVVLFDARGERLRPAPLEVKEGLVTSMAVGPEGRIAAGYSDVRGRRGGVMLFDARGERLRSRRWKSRRAVSGAWPSAGGPDRRGIWRRPRRRRRRGALRRPWRAAPTRPAGGQGGLCQ